MRQRQTRTRAISKAVEITGAESILYFDPINAVSGIVFHLLEEKLAKQVSLETIQSTIDRLGGKSLSIIQDRWTVMTNPQRLNWLLAETQTLPLAGEDDVVQLRPRRQ